MTQFVPLKVETNGEPWQKWARKYRHEGSSIPIIFVIRADGEMLYGKSGSKPGQELPAFMLQQLQQAGRIFSASELATLTTAVEEAKKALAEGNKVIAVRRLAALKKLGTPGQLGSFATVATEADGLVKQMIEEGQTRLKEAAEKLAVETSRFDGALTLVQAKRIYSPLPDLSKPAAEAYGNARRDKALAPLLEQAEAIDRAESLLLLADGKRRAAEQLERVATRYAGTPAEQFARRRYQEITETPLVVEAGSPSPATGAPATGAPALRTWTSSNGKYTIEAELVSFREGIVELRGKDGKVITLPAVKLSQADQQFLKR